MIIGHNFVYLHIPKTGGTSFCKMMSHRHNLEETVRWTRDEHNTARDILSDLRDSHFIFGLMRDPVTHEASNFYYNTTTWGNNCSPDFTFENWCEWRYGGKHEQWASQWLLNPANVRFGYAFSTRQTVGYFCDEDGNCIASRIYRFEDMKKSIGEISKDIGINCDLTGYHFFDSSRKTQPKPVVTDRCVELIRAAKPLDFILHGLDGDISTDFRCKTAPRYAYTRPGND